MIQWTNPNPCSRPDGGAFTLEGVNLSRTGANDGWVQVGWVRRQAYSFPTMYCEFTPAPGGTGTWELTEYTIPSASTYEYKMEYSPGAAAWACYLNGVGKRAHSSVEMGFVSGTWLAAQGETNATHAQIGKNAPDNLTIYAMAYKNAGSWTGMNISTNTPPFPYGVDEPLVGQLRNWTNAH